MDFSGEAIDSSNLFLELAPGMHNAPAAVPPGRHTG